MWIDIAGRYTDRDLTIPALNIIYEKRMAKEFSASYFSDSALMCDVMVFEDEEDYLIFKLKVTFGN
jgi:hypothetical protein